LHAFHAFDDLHDVTVWTTTGWRKTAWHGGNTRSNTF